MSPPLSASMGVVQARKDLGRLVRNAALMHRPSLITNGEAVGILLGADDVEDLTAGLTFDSQVYQDGEGVSAWLPELEVYGHGEDVEAALTDLAEEVREYVGEYLAEIDRYRNAPNRSDHFRYVVKAFALDASGRLEQSLLGAEAARP